MKPIENGIVHIELARPQKLNSLDLQMFESISDILRTIQNDKSIRVVILSGKGKAFCTGLDIKSFFHNYQPLSTMNRLLERSNSSDIANLAQNVAYLWRDLDIPVIAVLHGMCFGGGKILRSCIEIQALHLFLLMLIVIVIVIILIIIIIYYCGCCW